MRPLIFALPGNESFADKLGAALGADQGHLTRRAFPDGETYVRLDTPVAGRAVVLVCTLDRPDSKLLPLLFSAATARDLGATSIGLVCPYLAYMRQDRRFRPGEGVTSEYFAKVLSRWFDWLVTVDPHLHRHTSLSEIYSIPARALHASALIADWIARQIEAPVLIGPDSESEQWVGAVARAAGAPWVVLRKIRRGDRDVEVSVPHVERWAGHTPVLVDDIISTARTMIETVRHLHEAGMQAPLCIGVHGLFAGSAYQDLLAAGVRDIVTCNSVAHESNRIDVSGLITGGVQDMLASVAR